MVLDVLEANSEYLPGVTVTNIPQSDQRSHYCSEACRTRDVQPSSPSRQAALITSPLPPKFVPLPSTTPGGQRVDRRGSLQSTSYQMRIDAALRQPATPESHPRDRRAFSFPASEASVDGERPALPFARKAKAVNSSTPRSLKRPGYLSPEITKLSLSTGANTPNTPLDSAFYSTSDSEKDEPAPKRSHVTATSPHLPRRPLPMTTMDHAAMSQATSLSSQLHSTRPSLEARPATSPVTRMGSSSSRSREDIISWARGVDSRSDNMPRGRRGRRPDALDNLPPPSTESMDEHTSTTPQSGAFGALTMTSVVNALRNVSFSPSGANAYGSREQPSALGLQTVPAPAAVSRVEIVVGTRTTEDMAPFFAEGDTPTLSTISFSEAVDPSTTDMGETIESTADDYSVVSSHGRGSFYPRAAPATTTTTPSPLDRPKSTLPLRPIQTTASAIWNFSSYLRSLAPFTAPFTLASPSSTPTPELAKSDLATPDLVRSPLPVTQATPMPAARVDSTEFPIDPAQELVRSVPMDIVIAMGSKAQAITEERAREREVMEFLGPRSRSRTRIGASRSPSVEAHQPKARTPQPLPHTRQQSYDADQSESGQDSARGRGRRRARSRGGSRSAAEEETTPGVPTPAEDRGRRRARGGESRDRSWSAHRGRSSHRAAVRP